jgi:hypothetical protein
MKKIFVLSAAVACASVASNLTLGFMLLPFLLFNLFHLFDIPFVFISVGLLMLALWIYAGAFSFRWAYKYFSELQKTSS